MNTQEQIQWLNRVLHDAREEQRQKESEAKRRGFVFDPIVGYVPWGQYGPALEPESHN